MATLYISLFGGVDNLCASAPLGTTALTTSTTSAQSAANSGGALVASLYSDAAHYVAVGSNPTASASNGAYVPANTLFWLDLSADTAGKIAAVTLA